MLQVVAPGTVHRDGNDVTVYAPTAISGLVVPSPDRTPAADNATEVDLLTAALRDNARLRRDLRELGDTTSAISAVCLALVRMLLDAGKGSPFAPDRIDIPRGLHLALVGASISVGEDAAGNVTVTLRDRQRERVAVEV